jgi:ATP/maltotriose-dependent transcriptional regulator MalT
VAGPRAAPHDDQRPEEVALLLARRARLLLRVGRDGALADLEKAGRLVPEGVSQARGSVLEVLGAALISEGQAGRGEEVSAEAVRIAEHLGDERLRIAALTTQGMAFAHQGRHEQAVEALTSACALAERRGDLAGLTRVRVNLSVALWAIGRHAEAAEVAHAGLDPARGSGLSATLGAHLATNQAMALLALGRWDEADRVTAEALEQRPRGVFAAYLHLVRGELALARGDLAGAEENLSRTYDGLGLDFRQDEGRLPVARLEAEIALRRNDIDRARGAIARVIETARVRGQATAYAWPLLVVGARIEVRARTGERLLGERHDGGDLGEALRSVAADLQADTPPWRAYAVQFAAEMDSLKRASPKWSEVVAAWDEAGEPYAACHARIRAAETAIAAKDDPKARRWIDEAAATAERLGAALLAEDLATLGRIARLPVGDGSTVPGRKTDPAGLTVREAQVLRLLTDGCSNRDIGARLFISDKTASVHVSRILTKLGVTTRAEAAATAHRLHLFDDDRR